MASDSIHDFRFTIPAFDFRFFDLRNRSDCEIGALSFRPLHSPGIGWIASKAV